MNVQKSDQKKGTKKPFLCRIGLHKYEKIGDTRQFYDSIHSLLVEEVDTKKCQRCNDSIDIHHEYEYERREVNTHVLRLS